MLSYKFRLYPSKAAERKLSEQLGLCRWLYNRLLEELNKARAEGRRINKLETQALIVKLKKEEKPELALVNSKALQMVNHQLWSNIRALSELKKRGRKVGMLRFKGKEWYKTINFNQSGFRLDKKKLVLSKIGEVPVKLHREIETGAKIKGVVIKRESTGKWFAVFQVEKTLETKPKMGRVIGIDMGIKHFLTDSDGRQVENPCFYDNTLQKIRVLQHSLSKKKKKGSRNREKAKIKLANAYEKLVNQRDDFLHKLSRFYVNNYGLIAVEDLNIKGMIQNRLAGKILDASWGKFLQLLEYKAERAGAQVVEVNPRGTSQEYKHGELDRDYNASLNILERSLTGLGQPFEPVEVRPLLCVPAQAVITGQVLALEAGSPLR